MNSQYIELPQDSVDRIIRAAKALNNTWAERSIIARSVSLRIALVTYIVYYFFLNNIYALSIVAVFTGIFALTQLHIASLFIFKANYTFTDWKFLFTEQPRLSKLFFLGGVFLVGFLVYQIQSGHFVLESVAFLFLFIIASIGSLTDIIVDPYLEYEMKGRNSSIEEEVLDEYEEDSVKNQRYLQIAFDILVDKSQTQAVQQAPKQAEQGDYRSQMKPDDAPQNPKTPEDIKRLQEQARKKIESVNGSGSNPAALTPEGIDALTDEELKALLYTTRRNAPQDESYEWE